MFAMIIGLFSLTFVFFEQCFASCEHFFVHRFQGPKLGTGTLGQPGYIGPCGEPGYKELDFVCTLGNFVGK